MQNEGVLIKQNDPVSVVYCHDPVYPDKREITILPYERGMVLSDYLLLSGYQHNGLVVSINGAVIDDENLDVTDVFAGDCIVIMPTIDAPIIPLIAMASALALELTPLSGLYLFGAQAALMLGSALLMNALMPPPPKMDGENESIYSWGQIGNADSQGTVLPMLWGTHRVPGRVIEQYVSSSGDKQ
ncbi:hypothetical protein COS16_10970, partial [Candidatus Desantisbacteria bacterium CG02_land_8_20_14_3_00_49_13]